MKLKAKEAEELKQARKLLPLPGCLLDLRLISQASGTDSSLDHLAHLEKVLPHLHLRSIQLHLLQVKQPVRSINTLPVEMSR